MEFIQDFRELLLTRRNRELIAFKMDRSTRTIERWAAGETRPSPAEIDKLRRIIKNMLKRAVPDLSSAGRIMVNRKKEGK